MAPVAEPRGGRHHDFSPKAQLQDAVLLEGEAMVAAAAPGWVGPTLVGRTPGERSA